MVWLKYWEDNPFDGLLLSKFVNYKKKEKRLISHDFYYQDQARNKGLLAKYKLLHALKEDLKI